MVTTASLASADNLLNILLANYQYLAILILPFVSGMLYEFMQKGMIFEKYGNWIFAEMRANEDVKRHNASREIKKPEVEVPRYKKPLGACLKCMHVWVVILFGLFFLPQLSLASISILSLVKFILALSVSYRILVTKYY